MSTRMPISMLCRKVYREQGGFGIHLPGRDEVFWSPIIDDGIMKSILFDVQVANDIFMEKWKTKTHDKTHLAKLPYPLMWMEWRDAVMDRNIACILDDADGAYRPIDRGSGPGATFLTLQDGDPLPKIFPIEASNITVDTDGTVQVVEFGPVGRCELGTKRKDLENICHLYLLTALTALGLVNCKNVSVQDKYIATKRTGKQKRRKIPAQKIKYHTIILPGGGSESDGLGGHRATAIHRVRGHFKTFTAEKPLLGQHVGTYWWGWQVRGKAEKGIVVSDYSLEGAK